MTTILARPAFRSPNGESSSLLIAKELSSQQNLEVLEFNSTTVLKKKPSYVILHWPDNLIGLKVLSFALSLSTLICVLKLLKLKNSTRVIWIAHNTHSHYLNNKKEKIFWKLFLQEVDYAIYPLPTLLKSHLFSGRKIFIPFGPYTKRNENVKKSKKFIREYMINETDSYFLWYGIIKPYKNLEFLIDIFENELKETHIKLIIIGQAKDKKYFRKLQTLVKRSLLIDTYIEDDMFPTLFKISKAIILNYKNVSNSGSIRLALTYNKPVLCNYFDHLEDYNLVYKTNLLKLYKDKPSLVEEIYKLHAKETNIMDPKWSGLEWKDFAKSLIQKINE